MFEISRNKQAIGKGIWLDVSSMPPFGQRKLQESALLTAGADGARKLELIGSFVPKLLIYFLNASASQSIMRFSKGRNCGALNLHMTTLIFMILTWFTHPHTPSCPKLRR